MKKKNLHYSFFILSLCLFILLSKLPIFSRFDRVFYDTYQRIFPLKIKKAHVVFITIDQQSIEFLSKNSFVSWPWPRAVYAKLLERLQDAGAGKVVFDLLFSEQSGYGKEDDMVFKRAIRTYGNVYLPFVSGTGAEPSASNIANFHMDIFPQNLCAISRKILLPYNDFLEVAKEIGDARGYPDKDGIFRKYAPCVCVKNVCLPSLALSLTPQHTVPDKAYGKNHFLYPRFPKSSAFHRISFLDAITLPYDTLGKLLKGKTVIVGATAPGLMDLRPTSVSKKTPGIFLHATMIENFISNDFVSFPSNYGIIIVVIMILIIFHILYFLSSDSVGNKIFALVVPQIAGIIISSMLFNFFSFYITPVSLTIPVITLFILYISIDYALQGKEKRFVKNLFKHYVSAELLDEILKSPELVKLGGERKTITVMFSDIESFTTISERLEPEDVVLILNKLLEYMSDIILFEKGYIDKYEGDAIMAFWNAPISNDEHASRALISALKCLTKLRNEINPELTGQGFSPLNMRFGINTGDSVVGNIGSRKRFDYTAIGDTVNLASRLEGINKVYKTNVVASEFTVEKAKKENQGLFVFRDLDIVKVKGKEQPIKIYEVVGFSRETGQEKLDIIKTYETGLYLYRKGNFKNALDIFKKISKVDTTSEVMTERCKNLLKNPPEHWYGVYEAKTK